VKKEAIPQNFPMGARLSERLSKSFRTRGYAASPSRSLPPMISPYSRPAPQRRQGATLQGDIRSIRARNDGTLSQIMAAKSAPNALKSSDHPTLSTGGVDSDVSSGANVNRGTGLIRDAETQKVADARQLLRERLSALRV